jgi:Cytochrome D1 heme domain
MSSRLWALAAAALLLGLGASARADDTADLIHRCRNHDARWLLAARDVPPTLLLFDAEHKLVKSWPVASRNGQVASRIGAIVDAPARRSFVVALRDIAELWEISYDPKAEDFYDGLVHDFRMGEGLPVRGFLNPRRTFLSEPLESLRFDPVSTEVIGVANATLQRINLDVRRRVASQALTDKDRAGLVVADTATRCAQAGR